MLDELNYIGYGFLESATEYLIDETDEEYLEQELKWYFPEYLVNQDPNRCFSKQKHFMNGSRMKVFIAL